MLSVCRFVIVVLLWLIFKVLMWLLYVECGAKHHAQCLQVCYALDVVLVQSVDVVDCGAKHHAQCLQVCFMFTTTTS